MECRKCDQKLPQNVKFCFSCGVRVDIPQNCKGCGLEIKEFYRFCPSCGIPSGGEQVDATATRAKLPTSVEKVSDVKEKIMNLKRKSVDNRSTLKVPRKDLQGKRTYVIVCGVKEKRGKDLWVQVRGPNSPYRITKVNFNREDTYEKVINKLRAEFDLLDYEDDELHLLDQDNNIVSEHKFTVYDYIQKYKKYIGSNRLYIGLDPKFQLPPDLTPQKLEKEEHEHDEAASCISLNLETTDDDVDSYLMHEFIEDCSDKTELKHEGDLAVWREKKGFTAVYSRNDVVRYFLFLKESEGEKFEFSSTGWGEFVMLPDKKFDEFLTFKESVDQSKLAFLSPPLKKFIALNMNKSDEKLCIEAINDNFVHLDPDFRFEFREWCDRKKKEFA